MWYGLVFRCDISRDVLRDRYQHGGALADIDLYVVAISYLADTVHDGLDATWGICAVGMVALNT